MMANKDIVAHDDLAMLDPDGVFPARLAADRAALVALLSEMRSGPSETREERLKPIATLSHKLGGAAGTFGHVDVSDAALALEDLIGELPSDPSAAGWLESFNQAADMLVRTLDRVLCGQNL